MNVVESFLGFSDYPRKDLTTFITHYSLLIAILLLTHFYPTIRS